jgi:outer membrane murein-binding lipoprotein Lpp
MQLENDKRVLERKYNSLESQVSKLKAKIYRLESRDDAMDAD